jgi:hypothetical protein
MTIFISRHNAICILVFLTKFPWTATVTSLALASLSNATTNIIISFYFCFTRKKPRQALKLLLSQSISQKNYQNVKCGFNGYHYLMP